VLLVVGVDTDAAMECGGPRGVDATSWSELLADATWLKVAPPSIERQIPGVADR
jgi:hypothetical protein